MPFDNKEYLDSRVSDERNSAMEMWEFPLPKTHIMARKAANVLAVTSRRHGLAEL